MKRRDLRLSAGFGAAGLASKCKRQQFAFPSRRREILGIVLPGWLTSIGSDDADFIRLRDLNRIHLGP